LGDRAPMLERRHRNLRLAAVPFISEWNGRSRLELELKDFVVED
jgi:hypothetical protein